jgi:ribosomal protein S18 acetylase RimI-like enzyme
MAISLRPVEEGDQAFLYQLYASTRAEEMAAWGWAEAQREALLQMQFRAQQLHYQTQMPQATHRIICTDEQSVGRIITSEDAATITLADIALLPQYRSRGIGGMLIRDLLTSAAQSGRVVQLHVEVHNRARRLYERLGFRTISDDGIYYLMEASPSTP